MPWTVGIDEAGYGPNLGPFVMSSVACRVPDALASACLWQELQAAVRREGADDGRLLVADSKFVYSPQRGLKTLEVGVLSLAVGSAPATLSHLLDFLCPTAHAELREECWYKGDTLLPVQAQTEKLTTAVERLAMACADCGVTLGPVRTVVVCPSRFNAVTERGGTKSAVLSLCLVDLLRAGHDPDESEEAISFLVDKHGGRNNYSVLMRLALPDGRVEVEEEGMERSAYRVLGLRRPVRTSFEPRADTAHFCVALASMVSKYLRELFMLEFNLFWQAHVPGLKPTAGYPLDASRFFEEIRPTARRLGIDESALWRQK